MENTFYKQLADSRAKLREYKDSAFTKQQKALYFVFMNEIEKLEIAYEEEIGIKAPASKDDGIDASDIRAEILYNIQTGGVFAMFLMPLFSASSYEDFDAFVGYFTEILDSTRREFKDTSGYYLEELNTEKYDWLEKTTAELASFMQHFLILRLKNREFA